MLTCVRSPRRAHPTERSTCSSDRTGRERVPSRAPSPSGSVSLPRCASSLAERGGRALQLVTADAHSRADAPQVLGRSTKLSAFVKTDATDETWIEIELKGRSGKKNLIVRRYIYKDSEKSKFTLDGTSPSEAQRYDYTLTLALAGDEANASAVAEKMKELNVQVSNLWCALPLLISLQDDRC